MPYANMVSSVMPTSVLRGNREAFNTYPNERNFNRFPLWLGKNSTHSKNKRLLMELHSHCVAGGLFKADSASLRGEYVPLLKSLITTPLTKLSVGGLEKEGIPEVMQRMDAHSLTRQVRFGRFPNPGTLFGPITGDCLLRPHYEGLTLFVNNHRTGTACRTFASSKALGRNSRTSRPTYRPR